MCVIHQKNINCLKIYCKNEHKTGAEIKRYRGDKNWTVNDYSSVKKRKLDFEERKVEISYLNISTITNECPLNDVLHVHELLFNKTDEKSKWKNEKMLRIVEAKIKDQTGLIKLALFDDLIDKVKEDTGYSM